MLAYLLNHGLLFIIIFAIIVLILLIVGHFILITLGQAKGVARHRSCVHVLVILRLSAAVFLLSVLFIIGIRLLRDVVLLLLVSLLLINITALLLIIVHVVLLNIAFRLDILGLLFVNVSLLFINFGAHLGG